jgi:hypothetical protein
MVFPSLRFPNAAVAVIIALGAIKVEVEEAATKYHHNGDRRARRRHLDFMNVKYD